jgi:hypothetical protein
MYHPAAALRTPAIERESYSDIASVPAALIDARARRAASAAVEPPEPPPPPAPLEPEQPPTLAPVDTDTDPDSSSEVNASVASTDDATPQLTLF